jgi:tetratricopeptide (TPR) repeat protein
MDPHRKFFRIFVWLAALVQLVVCTAALGGQDTRFEQFSPREEMNRKEQIRRNPRDATAWFFLGRFYDFTHRTQDAAEAFRQATLIKPGWAEAFFNLGKMYRAIGRYREAAQALERATIIKSNYSRAYFFLGLIYLDLERPKAAAQALNQAYMHDPGYFETYFDTTSYGMHSELVNKDSVLGVIRTVYPMNQQLAQILYKRWARYGINMQDFYEVVSGADKKSEAGYQEAQEVGYQEQPLPGYQKPPPAGFTR